MVVTMMSSGEMNTQGHDVTTRSLDSGKDIVAAARHAG
jgi:hypothetical protein